MTNNKKKYNTGNVRGDSEIARAAEDKCIRIMQLAFNGNVEFENLHDKPEFWHRGDVKCTCGNEVLYGDVKDESMIHKTGNVFAENFKYFADRKKGYVRADGWVKASNYDLVFILDDVDDNIYVLDFQKLKAIYERYPQRHSKLSDCEAYGNCVPLSECRKHKVLRYHIKYEENKDGSIDIEYVTNCLTSGIGSCADAQMNAA